MSFPYIASDGTLWAIDPPDPDASPITQDDGDGPYTVNPTWHGRLTVAAYGFPAGTVLVAGQASSDADAIADMKSAIESYVTAPHDKKVEKPSTAPPGGASLWWLLAVLWALDQVDKKKKGRR